MCLRIGTTDFCSLLGQAPLFHGNSLERLQHDLEENDPKVVCTPELETAIAGACGLTLADYRSRCALVRGENAIKALKHENFLKIGLRENPWFTFSAEVGQWIRGEAPAYPGVFWISPESEVIVHTLLGKLRYQCFTHRLNSNDETLRIWKYPERISWHLQLRADTDGRLRSNFSRHLRYMLTKRGALDITNDVRLSLGEIERLVELRTQDFLYGQWLPDRDIVLSLLTRNEAIKLGEFSSRRENLARYSGRRAKTRKRKEFRYQSDFRDWCRSVHPKYEAEFSRRLLEHLLQNNLEDQASSLARAA